MRAGASGLLILATSLLSVAGCDNSPPSDGNHVSSVAEPCSPPSQQPLVFYDENGDPSESTPALTEREFGEITAWVATQTSDPIWLIRVKPSFSNGKGERAGVDVYLVPDETTPRLRTGRAYSVPLFERWMGSASPWKYVQVAIGGQDFDERHIKPSLIDMPIRWSEVVASESRMSSLVSKEELIRIVDFVRQPSNYQDSIVRATRAAGRPGPHELPILEIHRKGERIRVTSGFQHSGLWGRGWMIEVECTSSGYEVKSCGMWMS